LAAESGGVLSWLIEGAVVWARTMDVPRCAAVERASEEYFGGQTTVESWVKECCVRQGGATLGAGVAYDAYRAWKAARGEKPVSVVRFSEQMLVMFEHRMLDGRRLFTDVRLAENANPL
jgi:phage/plasmid-associated DNA primase